MTDYNILDQHIKKYVKGGCLLTLKRALTSQKLPCSRNQFWKKIKNDNKIKYNYPSLSRRADLDEQGALLRAPLPVIERRRAHGRADHRQMPLRRSFGLVRRATERVDATFARLFRLAVAVAAAVSGTGVRALRVQRQLLLVGSVVERRQRRRRRRRLRVGRCFFTLRRLIW